MFANKLRFFISSILLLSVNVNPALSHSGRTNAEGCHNDNKNGGYHCHNNGYQSNPTPNYNSSDYQHNSDSYSQPQSDGNPQTQSLTEKYNNFMDFIDTAQDRINKKNYLSALIATNTAKNLASYFISYAELSGGIPEEIAKFKAHINVMLVWKYINICIYLYDSGNYPKALEAIEEAVNIAPNFPMTRHEKGIVLKAMGQNEQALYELRTARLLIDNPENLTLKDPLNSDNDIRMTKPEVDKATMDKYIKELSNLY